MELWQRFTIEQWGDFSIDDWANFYVCFTFDVTITPHRLVITTKILNPLVTFPAPETYPTSITIPRLQEIIAIMENTPIEPDPPSGSIRGKMPSPKSNPMKNAINKIEELG